MSPRVPPPSILQLPTLLDLAINHSSGGELRSLLLNVCLGHCECRCCFGGKGVVGIGMMVKIGWFWNEFVGRYVRHRALIVQHSESTLPSGTISSHVSDVARIFHTRSG